MEFTCILDVGILMRTKSLLEEFPDTKQYLFEPMSEWYDAIHKNYANHDYELIEAACSDNDGEAEFVSMHKLEGLGRPSHGQLVRPGINPKVENTVNDVKTMRLDTFVAERGLSGPFLLKIDVDGLEINVMRGAKETLESCDVVSIEVARHSLPGRVAFLAERGFFLHSIADLELGHLKAASEDAADEPGSGFLQCDMIFLNGKYRDDPRFRPER